MQVGFHTDAFNSSYWSFDQCLDWGQRNGIHFIECGSIDGVSWVHGLGYQPHVALWQDPVLLRKKMEKQELQFSQLDAAFPLSGCRSAFAREPDAACWDQKRRPARRRTARIAASTPA